MKGPRELRQIINRMRSRAARMGKKNGALGWYDCPGIERLGWNRKRKDIVAKPNPSSLLPPA